MVRYCLSRHTYVCVVSGYAVFLDLRQDKYTALEPTDAQVLSSVVEGWPTGGDLVLEPQTGGSEEVIRALLDERLLTDDKSAGKPATPVLLAPPTATLMASPRHIPRVDRWHLSNFVAAWLSVSTLLGVLPLRVGVERARRRKARKGALTREFEARQAHGLMMAYLILRPNFFSAVDACLKDSMTVIEFLARYDVFPTWVFGVKMNPFAAHSWVQAGPIVLNDTVYHVRKFTPIMAI